MNKLSSVILVSSTLLINACKQDYNGAVITTEESPRATPVRLHELQPMSQPIPIEAGGRLTSKQEIDLSFKVGGFIDQLKFDEGQRVRKGQLMAEVNPTEINAQVLKAEQQVQKLQRDLDRIEKLYADTAATLEQVQDLTTALEVAEADLKIAAYNQNYAKIYAPVSGRILQRFAERNELITPGQPIFQIASDGRNAFIMNIGIADRDVVRLRLGDPAEIRLDAYPGQTFAARITEIAASANPLTGTFDIELTIDPAGNPLKNGFIGKVKIFPSQQAAYYRIPMDALVEGYREKAKVFLTDSTQTVVASKTVRPEYVGADFFTVREDELPTGAFVVTDGAAYLQEQSEIEVIGTPELLGDTFEIKN